MANYFIVNLIKRKPFSPRVADNVALVCLENLRPKPVLTYSVHKPIGFSEAAWGINLDKIYSIIWQRCDIRSVLSKSCRCRRCKVPFMQDKVWHVDGYRTADSQETEMESNYYIIQGPFQQSLIHTSKGLRPPPIRVGLFSILHFLRLWYLIQNTSNILHYTYMCSYCSCNMCIGNFLIRIVISFNIPTVEILCSVLDFQCLVSCFNYL